MKKAEPMFVGFVLGRCEMILSTYRDDLPQEVFDALREMRDTANHIAKGYYETEIEEQAAPKMDNQTANSRQRKQKGL